MTVRGRQKVLRILGRFLATLFRNLQKDPEINSGWHFLYKNYEVFQKIEKLQNPCYILFMTEKEIVLYHGSNEESETIL